MKSATKKNAAVKKGAKNTGAKKTLLMQELSGQVLVAVSKWFGRFAQCTHSSGQLRVLVKN